ncbi:hypothetical protein VPH35_028323 [Triticum aestivum]
MSLFKEFKYGRGAADGWMLANTKVAHGRSEIFHLLLALVKTLGDYKAVMGEVLGKHNKALEHQVLPITSVDAKVVQPVAQNNQVYLKQGHCPSPEKRKSNSPLDKAIEEPSEIDVLTALFEMNGYLVDTVLG